MQSGRLPHKLVVYTVRSGLRIYVFCCELTGRVCFILLTEEKVDRPEYHESTSGHKTNTNYLIGIPRTSCM